MQLARHPRGRAHARTFEDAQVRHRDYGGAYPPPEAVGSDWIGWRVTDETGRTAGRVEGTINDQWLIIRDRRSHRLIAPSTEAIAGGEAVFLPYSHELIYSAPEVESEESIDRELLERARRHFEDG
jgi:hypothetical protein